MSRVGKTLSHYKGEILTGAGLIAGAGALVFSFFETPKARTHIAEHKKTFNEMRIRKHEGKTDKNLYKKEYLKELGVTAKDFAWDMKGTIICEALSVGLGIAGCATMRKGITAASTTAASALGLLAMTEAAIKEEYGEEGFQKISERRNKPIKISERRVNPKTGEMEEHEYIMEPQEVEYLDDNVRKIVETLPEGARAGFDPAHCVVIDEGNITYRMTNGNLDLIVPTLQTAFRNINWEMQCRDGEINLRRELDILGFADTRSDRFNQEILKVAGTIDTPTAKDLVTGKIIRVKGFNTDGTASDRYGEYTHKQISFGEDQDAYLFCDTITRESEYPNPWFIIDGKIILNLSYDGNTNELIPEKLTPERKRSAWIENPEYEK
jgi:hypothetical protein